MPGADPGAWDLLPAEQIFALPVADPRAPLSRIFVHALDGGTRIDAAVAADFPLIELRPGPLRVQVGLEAGVYMDFDAADELTFDLETFDGRFGLPFDLAWGRWSARIEPAHLSAHYGDGVRQGEARPENLDPYSREFLTVLLARSFFHPVVGEAHVYAGGHALLHSLPEAEPWALQLGGDVVGPWIVAPYLAADLRLAAEHAWVPQVGAQLGAAVIVAERRLRVGAVAHLGPDDTGKRSGETERYLGVAFGFDATGKITRDPGR